MLQVRVIAFSVLILATKRFASNSDVPATRTLRVASFTDVDNMTIESCIAFCTPSGYQFAGVEFARVSDRDQITVQFTSTDNHSLLGMLYDISSST